MGLEYKIHIFKWKNCANHFQSKQKTIQARVFLHAYSVLLTIYYLLIQYSMPCQLDMLGLNYLSVDRIVYSISSSIREENKTSVWNKSSNLSCIYSSNDQMSLPEVELIFEWILLLWTVMSVNVYRSGAQVVQSLAILTTLACVWLGLCWLELEFGRLSNQTIWHT